MNVRKIRQLGKDILREPRRFNMNTFGRPADEAIKLHTHSKDASPPCGTVMCFAGHWGLRYGKVDPIELSRAHESGGDVYGPEESYIDLPLATERDLDLPNDDLFYVAQWPEELQPARDCQPGTDEYARHFVNVVLESYIRTDGWTIEEG